MVKLTQAVLSFVGYLATASAFVPHAFQSNQLYHGSGCLMMTTDQEGLSRREVLSKSLVWTAGIAGLSFNPQQSEAAPSGSALDTVMRGYADKIRKVSKTLDELQRDIFQEDWELVATYPSTLRALVPIFTRYTDTKFAGETEIEKNSRVALRYEVGRLFGGVERLKKAAEKQNADDAFAAFSQMSVAYDRYLKAGYLYDAYDPVVSTEVFYANIGDKSLKYDSPTDFPPKIKDLVLVLSGPDKGKTGTLIGIDETVSSRGEKMKKAIVKLDNTIGRVQKIREIKVINYNFIAKRELSDDEDPVMNLKK